MASEPQPLQTPSLPQVLEAAIDAALEDVHTCSWGSVLSYDAASQTCSVQLIQRRAYTDEGGERQTERPAPLLEVPVLFMGAGPYSITWPLVAGDVVLLLFMERAMDAWHASGQQDVDAGDDRRHSMSDAVAVPGLRSRKHKIDTPPSDAMVLTAPKLQLGSKGATDHVALVPGVEQAIRDAFTDGALMGSFAAYQTALATGNPTLIGPALGDLNTALNTHFTAQPVQGASKVTAE